MIDSLKDAKALVQGLEAFCNNSVFVSAKDLKVMKMALDTLNLEGGSPASRIRSVLWHLADLASLVEMVSASARKSKDLKDLKDAMQSANAHEALGHDVVVVLRALRASLPASLRSPSKE